ncbi:glycosyltransferase family 2 protein [Gammaproteobacteria bacterium]|nr:glycosyltransferase family 2 protein [Gammaproteobacteria bacterium]
MKKLKVYIVTYKRSDVLNELIDNIFESDFKDIPNTEVNIINNHSTFELTSKYKDRIDSVYHHMVRPDWSGGNLGENWNQALMLGFKSLIQPNAEYVITLQNDCVLHPDWYSHLMNMHEKYNFIAGEFGDNIISYTPEAVRRIGLWDEQFSGGGHREADYYLRALRFNKQHSLINDTMHGRVWNPNDDYLTLDIPGNRNIKSVDGTMKRRPDNKEQERIWTGVRGGVMNEYNTQYFYWKWANTHHVELTKSKWIKNWPIDLVTDPPLIRKNIVFMKYPYFEKDICDLRKKGYWVPSSFGARHWSEWESRIRSSNPDSY